MDFYRRVALVCQSIPKGKVATYGQIALLCGYPTHARQVGHGLKCRREESVPAHRVVNSQGYLSGAALFSEPGGQQRRLRKEGVLVEVDRVDLKRYRWENSWEEALRLREEFEKRGI